MIFSHSINMKLFSNVCYESLEDFATLNAVYGAFGGMLALLLWIYLSGSVFIFGACLCAGQAEALEQPAT